MLTMFTRLIAIAVIATGLQGCDPKTDSLSKALDVLTEQSTDHTSTTALNLYAANSSEELSSSVPAPSAADSIPTSSSASSSSVYVAPLTEECLPGEKVFRLWDCGPDGHRVYW